MFYLMILIGVILLLPGICTIVFVVGLAFVDTRSLSEPDLIALWAICLAVSVGGGFLIRAARRRRGSGP